MGYLIDKDLYHKVENNLLDKVTELLEDPKRYFYTDANYGANRRPLISIAVETGNEKMVKVLCHHGFSVDEFDALGMTPLHLAVSIGNLSMAKTLLLHGAKPDSHSSVSSSSPLHLAAEKMGCTEHFSLLTKNCNLNVRDLEGQTPLMRACYFGHKDKIAILLQKGSNPLISSKSGETAFSLLCQYPAVTDVHIRNFVDNLVGGHKQRRHIINEMSGIGDRPIHMLIRSRTKAKVPAMKALINYGASIDIKNWSGYTPLALACVLKDTHAARLLLVSGSSLHEFDAYKRTPLEIAAEGKNYDLLGLLVRAGARLNLFVDDNSTWLKLPQATKDWIQGRSKVIRPLTYWARLSLIDYNRNCLKKIFPDELCLPETLNYYLNYLEEDELDEKPPLDGS
uniref:Microtubuleassociated protein futschlike [Aplysia californica] n=1 Tax=Lepeophtheirus salmonis TaxID=72036 RepID=A0A0K2TZN0_LEPSM